MCGDRNDKITTIYFNRFEKGIRDVPIQKAYDLSCNYNDYSL